MIPPGSAGHQRQCNQGTGYQNINQGSKARIHLSRHGRILTAFFEVPKREDGIHLVYDGSMSRLNLSIWVPRFFLPAICTHLQAVDEDMFMADVYIGEMLLNFIPHPELQSLAGWI
jgi:hypothetical protein